MCVGRLKPASEASTRNDFDMKRRPECALALPSPRPPLVEGLSGEMCWRSEVVGSSFLDILLGGAEEMLLQSKMRCEVGGEKLLGDVNADGGWPCEGSSLSGGLMA